MNEAALATSGQLAAMLAPPPPPEVPARPPPPFEPGVFFDMPAETYHAIEAMSASGSKVIRDQSPLHYRCWREALRTSTRAKDIGTAIHAAILEPHAVESRIAVLPDTAPARPGERLINAKKPSPETVERVNWWRDFDAANADKLVLPADDFSIVLRCRDAVYRHPRARLLLEHVRTEVSIFWNLEVATGPQTIEVIPCKARIDALITDAHPVPEIHGGMLDIKSTEDASAAAFGKSVAGYSYHGQGAHYYTGGEHVFHRTPPFFVFIAVEKNPPHGVALYELRQDAVLAGQNLMGRSYRLYAEARKRNFWASYPDTIEPAQLPGWALKVPV